MLSHLSFPSSSTVHVPRGLVEPGAAWRGVDLDVRFGLAIHPKEGVILIDTGYSARVAGTFGPRALYSAALNPKLVSPHPARDAVEALGAKADDVRAIILTHFHADHVCAVRDFPKARLFADGAGARRIERMSPFSRLHNGVFLELMPDDWTGRILDPKETATRVGPAGVGEVHDIFGDQSVCTVALPGHGIGHIGAILAGHSGETLYGGDAAFTLPAIGDERTSLAGRFVETDTTEASRTRKKLDAWRAHHPLVLCHDPDPLTC
jgi:glyoxylase-like metal-dependent hydrolase (beta-lactamase superfamily II)